MALDPASCQNSLVLPRRIALLVLAVVWILPLSGVAEAASALTEVEERALAQRFAPVLVFHPEERFFPTSPLFQLADDEQIPHEPARTPRAAVDLLGTPQGRREQYLALTLPEKLGLATVYYRMRSLSQNSGSAIVIEYWFYYVWNEYSVRPGLFPFWFDSSHPNDLEHLHVVLARDRAGAVRVRSVYASAHEGMTPANRSDYAESDDPTDGTHILVELGSHALGPDNDHDGVYTPGHDGDSGYKIVWGVRDKGLSWSRYNPSYMDPRDTSRAVSLCAEASAAGPRSPDACPPEALGYRLTDLNDLYSRFERLDLSPKTREQVFETDVHPFKRLLGKSNGQSERLVLPPQTSPDHGTFTIEDFSATERGIMLGITTLISDPGFFLAGRYSFLHGKGGLPDLMLQAEQVVTIFGRGYFSTAALASYHIDAVTKAFGGVGFVTDTIALDRWQQDWIGGLEFRLGPSRISVTGRTLGSITHSALDVRLLYFF